MMLYYRFIVKRLLTISLSSDEKNIIYVSLTLHTEIDLESSEVTDSEEEDFTGRIKHWWIDPSTEDEHTILLDHVALYITSKAGSQPVMVSIKETDVTQLRKQQLESLGLHDVLTSVIQLSLKPAGLTLNLVEIDIKNEEWADSGGALLVLRKEDKWTDITSECEQYTRGKREGFEIKTFAEMELLLCSSHSALQQVSEIAEMLNRAVVSKSQDDIAHQTNYQTEEETSTSHDAKKSKKDTDDK